MRVADNSSGIADGASRLGLAAARAFGMALARVYAGPVSLPPQPLAAEA